MCSMEGVWPWSDSGQVLYQREKVSSQATWNFNFYICISQIVPPVQISEPGPWIHKLISRWINKAISVSFKAWPWVDPVLALVIALAHTRGIQIKCPFKGIFSPGTVTRFLDKIKNQCKFMFKKFVFYKRLCNNSNTKANLSFWALVGLTLPKCENGPSHKFSI